MMPLTPLLQNHLQIVLSHLSEDFDTQKLTDEALACFLSVILLATVW